MKMNLIITCKNPAVADALGAEITGIPLKMARHISVAQREEIGTINLREAKINDGWEHFKKHFQRRKTFIDRISILPFKSFYSKNGV